MKRMIVAVTSKSDIIRLIISGLKQAGCTFDKKCILPVDDSKHKCQLEFTLPSGKKTRVTFYYQFNRVSVTKQGNHNTLSKWDSTWTVNQNGEVFDASGNCIGVAIVRQTLKGQYQKKVDDYLPDSILVDSGDVVIEHPELVNDYLSLVDHLEKRNVTQFS